MSFDPNGPCHAGEYNTDILINIPDNNDIMIGRAGASREHLIAVTSRESHDGSNHKRLDRLFNSLLKPITKKTPKHRIIGPF